MHGQENMINAEQPLLQTEHFMPDEHPGEYTSLLSSDTDKDYEDDIFYAVKQGDMSRTRPLLTTYPDINKPNIHGETLLFHAIKGHHTDIVSLLIKNGALLNTKSTRSAYPIHNALEYAPHYKKDNLTLYDNTIVTYILDKLPESASYKDFFGDTALHIALFHNNIEALKQILNTGKALIDTPNEPGETPLMHAIMYNNIEGLNLILRYGADPNEETQPIFGQGISPLDIALYKKNDDIINLLLSYGADITQKHIKQPSNNLVAQTHYIDNAIRINRPVSLLIDEYPENDHLKIIRRIIIRWFNQKTSPDSIQSVIRYMIQHPEIYRALKEEPFMNSLLTSDRFKKERSKIMMQKNIARILLSNDNNDATIR
jgi:ankyrin repeat protein